MTRDENNIRIRPGKGRGRSLGRPSGAPRWLPSFTDQVRQAVRRQGHNPDWPIGTGKRNGRFNARGRGAKVAAGLKGRNAWSRGPDGSRTRSPRVTVKARIVKLNPAAWGSAWPVMRQREDCRCAPALP